MSHGDMFLKIEGSKQGVIMGESKDTSHKEEVDVLSWSWGMQSHASIQSGLSAGKTSISELLVTKRADRASTAMMACLRNNEVIKKATLTVRKAGQNPLEYLKIVLEQARIVSFSTDGGTAEGGPEIKETVGLAFKKISVQYTPQGDDGHATGSTSFETEI
jgi:type VI secretion system secreted protein Hcp